MFRPSAGMSRRQDVERGQAHVHFNRHEDLGGSGARKGPDGAYCHAEDIAA